MARFASLFEMHDFHEWTAGALWEDLKFDFKHWRDIERLAIVGDLAVVCMALLFTPAAGNGHALSAEEANF